MVFTKNRTLRYVECGYAECGDYLNSMLSAIMLNVVMLSVGCHLMARKASDYKDNRQGYCS